MLPLGAFWRVFAPDGGKMVPSGAGGWGRRGKEKEKEKEEKKDVEGGMRGGEGGEVGMEKGKGKEVGRGGDEEGNGWEWRRRGREGKGEGEKRRARGREGGGRRGRTGFRRWAALSRGVGGSMICSPWGLRPLRLFRSRALREQAPDGPTTKQPGVQLYAGLQIVERKTGFGPATSTLARLRSTN